MNGGPAGGPLRQRRNIREDRTTGRLRGVAVRRAQAGCGLPGSGDKRGRLVVHLALQKPPELVHRSTRAPRARCAGLWSLSQQGTLNFAGHFEFRKPHCINNLSVGQRPRETGSKTAINDPGAVRDWSRLLSRGAFCSDRRASNWFCPIDCSARTPPASREGMAFIHL